METPDRDVTTLLHLAKKGNQEAQDQLFKKVEAELRKRARALLSSEEPGHLLQTTVLIDDAFLKLVGNQSVQWENRSQFYRFAAGVMRHILVDEARKRKARKRTPGASPERRRNAEEPAAPDSRHPDTWLAVHEALDKLAATHPHHVDLVVLRFFGGWELKQISQEILNIPYGKVKEMWQEAKQRLYQLMKENQS